jgi:hypothetical protein
MGTTQLENPEYRVRLDDNGSIVGLHLKRADIELIQDQRLSQAFRINLPLEGALDHYLTEENGEPSIKQPTESTATISYGELISPEGMFDLKPAFEIDLDDDKIQFSYNIQNDTEYPLAEIWYPIFGGLRGLGERQSTESIAPGYYQGTIDHDVFNKFQGTFYGNEDGYMVVSYPGELTMPWINWRNEQRDVGLYLGEHNEVCRQISFVSQLKPGFHDTNGMIDQEAKHDTWPSPDEIDDDIPYGLTFSKVAYPHTESGTFDSGNFVFKQHKGDWHEAASIYRDWFTNHFGVDQNPSWLRKEQAWFTSILKQPEDRVVGNYEDYVKWMKTASEYGIRTGELIGWDSGGLERNYPKYVPDKELGGWDGYENLIEEIHDLESRLLTFVNYHMLDSCTDEYHDRFHEFRNMDSFGNTENSWGWGESTLKAALRYDVRRHVRASPAIEEYQELLESYLLPLVRSGTDGFQIDKLVTGGLDFNPRHDSDPDTVLNENLVRAVEQLYKQCQDINPEFALAGEASIDRFIPFIDVYYRGATPQNISPLRYAFPEWTSCVHCSSPYDYNAVNGALAFGAVLAVEPYQYTASMEEPGFTDLASYIKECLSLREEYKDRIFISDYLDDVGITIETESDDLIYKVHANYETDEKALVVANQGRESVDYKYQLTSAVKDELLLVQPFEDDRTVPAEGELTIPDEHVHILLE